MRKLPFEDGAFDHVRAVAIAKGVPENMVSPIPSPATMPRLIYLQWDPLFEEITRVLCPGGSFEMVEEGQLASRPLSSRFLSVQ